MPVRFDLATMEALRREGTRRGSSVAEIVRRAVEEHFAREGAVTDALRRAVDEAMRPHVNRLAALSSKAVIQASMAKWVAIAVTERLPAVPKDAEPAFPEAEEDEFLDKVHRYALEDLKARRQAEVVTEAEAHRMADAGRESS